VDLLHHFPGTVKVLAHRVISLKQKVLLTVLIRKGVDIADHNVRKDGTLRSGHQMN